MVSEIIKLLWGLQQVDNEIDYLTKKANEIPEKIKGLNLHLEQETKNLEQNRANVINYKKEYKLAEVDLKTCEEKIAQYQVQLYSAKTNEQYKAFLKEIENQKKLKNEIEDKMIELLEKIENTEREIKRKEKEIEIIKEDTQKKIEELKKEEEKIREEIKKREEKRKELISSLPVNYYEIYEKIKKRRNGIAVAKIENEVCGICFNPIPPQTVIEIRKNENIYYCDYCGRILVVIE
ncbi:MAG: C4-type zinc ribbon domain-containing protein [candidate division WOR-3 bacterium]|nr:C4-type zinc ribbon domain-containing protein [candidate division WOR-3 bacterium]MCX7836344.1 C4-type zinc ribbon domain-containing protein [candidate division WOR-3 bacterium]MDW8113551.1 C4-type zinc ribbon domain-containing protein [candidate division WOR-3 bacterium]